MGCKLQCLLQRIGNTGITCTRYGGWDRSSPSSCVSVLQVEVQLSLPIAQPGKYVLVVEYANPNALHPVAVAISSPHLAMQQGTFTFYPCVYRYGEL